MRVKRLGGSILHDDFELINKSKIETAKIDTILEKKKLRR